MLVLSTLINFLSVINEGSYLEKTKDIGDPYGYSVNSLNMEDLATRYKVTRHFQLSCAFNEFLYGG